MRYLVVANKTLCQQQLAVRIAELVAAGPCELHVVVPATPPTESLVYTEGEARAVAYRRLVQALTTFEEMGAKVDGEIGDANPMLAILDTLRTRQFDEIVLSTEPPGVSRWLRQDLPNRVRRTFAIPVSHVTAQPDLVS
jgi:hypothetical protein